VLGSRWCFHPVCWSCSGAYDLALTFVAIDYLAL
jgi:hypothetical protein